LIGISFLTVHSSTEQSYRVDQGQQGGFAPELEICERRVEWDVAKGECQGQKEVIGLVFRRLHVNDMSRPAWNWSALQAFSG